MQFASKFDPKTLIDVRSVRQELEALLTEKLEFLTAARVKKVQQSRYAFIIHVYFCYDSLFELFWWLWHARSCHSVDVHYRMHADVSSFFCILCPTQLIEDIIRAHLGWLIVWGNVFGECCC